MLYDTSEYSFNNALNCLQRTYSNIEGFLEYFRKYWLECKHLWAGFGLNGVVTYNESTNNRLESKNQKIKRYCGKDQPLNLFVERFLRYLEADFEESITKQAREKNTSLRAKGNESQIVSVFRRNCATKIYNIVRKNQNFAGAYNFSIFSETESAISISDKFGDEFTVEKSPLSCTCINFFQTKIPCEHLIFLSFKNKISYSENDIPRKYLLDETTPQVRISEPSAQKNPDVIKLRDKMHAKTKNEKFNAIKSILMSIADLSSSFGTEKFNEYLKYFEKIEMMMRNNVTIPGIEQIEEKIEEENIISDSPTPADDEITPFTNLTFDEVIFCDFYIKLLGIGRYQLSRDSEAGTAEAK